MCRGRSNQENTSTAATALVSDVLFHTILFLECYTLCLEPKRNDTLTFH